MQKIRAQVKEFIEAALEENGYSVDISVDDSLIDVGLMDSLSLLILLSFLEETFGIIPESDELSIETFDSVNDIIKFVERKLS